MKTKTTYRKKSRIWSKKIREIARNFTMDITAVNTAEIVGLNIKTIQDWYRYIRMGTYAHQTSEKEEILSWEIELDESYFWPTRVRWKRGRWAGLHHPALKVQGGVVWNLFP